MASSPGCTDQPGSATPGTPGTAPRSLLATAQHSPAPRRGPHLVCRAPASQPAAAALNSRQFMRMTAGWWCSTVPTAASGYCVWLVMPE
ncbi:hypothetical protein GCM10010300_46110 [Streptomyces olivaceoviridis]|nr:hypothetical protein GCM10010300_46110 [Streptomyces olivaceoviridis]